MTSTSAAAGFPVETCVVTIANSSKPSSSSSTLTHTHQVGTANAKVSVFLAQKTLALGELYILYTTLQFTVSCIAENAFALISIYVQENDVCVCVRA